MRIERIKREELSVDDLAEIICTGFINSQRYKSDMHTTEYKCLPTQNWMYCYGLSNCIDIEVPVKKETISLDKLYSSVYEIFSTLGLFRSSIIKKGNELYFREYELVSEFPIPIVSVGENEKKTLMHIVNQKMSDDLCSNLLGKPLAYVYILETDMCFNVIFSLSHSVSDGGTDFAIIRLLRMAMKGKSLAETPQYRDYISMVREKNSDTRVIDKYMDAMLDLNSKLPEITVDYGEFCLKKLSIQDETEWISVIVKAVHCLGTCVCEKYNLSRVVIKTTVNCREFHGSMYSTLVGDCHSNMFIIVDRDIDFPTFKEKTIEMINEFYRKGGIDFTYLRLKDFDLEKTFDRTNKYQILADTTKFAIAVNTTNESQLDGALAHLNKISVQRSKKKEAFGNYY